MSAAIEVPIWDVVEPEERATPTDDRELGFALLDYGAMQCKVIKREIWTEFGWWLLDRTPLREWTQDVVCDAWYEWQEERNEKAAKQ